MLYYALLRKSFSQSYFKTILNLIYHILIINILLYKYK